MLKRVLVAVVFIPLIFVVFFLLPPLCLPIVLSILSMVAVHEVLWSAGFVGHFRISAYSIALSGAVPFWVFFDEPRLPMLCTLLLYLTLLFVEAFFSDFSVTLEKMGGAFFFAVLIPYFLSSFVRIGQLSDYNLKLLIPLAAAFGSDAFALFGGLLFGRHKLAPRLSPNKTIEGAVGGVFGALLLSLGYAAVLQFAFSTKVDYLRFAVYGFFGSLAAQVGDLAFSYIKRQYNIKDFGNVFPGHGGVLDRCDSVIFAAPLIEILLVLLPAVRA